MQLQGAQLREVLIVIPKVAGEVSGKLAVPEAKRDKAWVSPISCSSDFQQVPPAATEAQAGPRTGHTGDA